MSASASLRTEPLNHAPANDEREARARRLALKHSGEEALEILRVAIKEEFPGRIALVSSFGAESAALLHLAAQVDPTIPVIFLETGKHFAQTLSYRKKLAAKLGLTDVRDIQPSKEALTFRDPKGDLWKHDADACCTRRKQFHGGGRLNLPAFEASPTHIKVNPLVRWGKEDIDAYYETHDLPAHPLIAQGYPSIGCWPCTHPAAAGEDIRAGRWRGAAKTECGIHGRTTA